MRFLSRIGSWLRTKVPATSPTSALMSTATARALDPSLPQRLPRTPPAAFQARLKEALEKSRTSVQVATLDPSIKLIAISQRSLGKDGDSEIDAALPLIEANGGQLSSLTWSALRDARPTFNPTPAEWGADVAHLLESDAGLIFFVDVPAIAVAIAEAAEQQGFTTRLDEDHTVVRVADGRFQALISTNFVIAEALWTGCGPLTAILRRVRQLPAEFRTFTAIKQGLERAFIGTRFDVVGDHIVARRAGLPPATIDYRHLAAAARASDAGVDTFLRGASFEDLVERDGDVVMLLRSEAYARARPNALHTVHPDGGLLALAVEADGRLLPIEARPDDPPDRFAFLAREAARQLPYFQVEGHAFVVEPLRSGPEADTGARAFGIVGDKAASLALDPALIRGFCEQLGPVPREVEVIADSENVLVVVAAGSNALVLDEALRRAHRLEEALFDDHADPIELHQQRQVPAVGSGLFALTVVPDEFFVMLEQADSDGDLGRAHADFLRGLAYETLELMDKAIASFERAIRARRDDGELHLALGRCLSAIGNHERAATVLTRATVALPDHAEVQNALGVALYKSGAATDARQAFLRAVKLAPDEASFLINLGRTCCDERRYGEARTVLEQALRLDPSSAEAHASMAVLCHRTGERRLAMVHARAALAEHPDDDTVRELMRMIDDDDDDDDDDGDEGPPRAV